MYEVKVKHLKGGDEMTIVDGKKWYVVLCPSDPLVDASGSTMAVHTHLGVLFLDPDAKVIVK